MLRFSAEPISSAKLANHLNNIKSLSARGQPSVLLPQKEFSRSWEYRPKKKKRRAKANNIRYFRKGEQYRCRNRKNRRESNNH